MNTNPSPIEYLAAFTITFLAGAVSAIALQSYVKWVKNSNNSCPK